MLNCTPPTVPLYSGLIPDSPLQWIASRSGNDDDECDDDEWEDDDGDGDGDECGDEDNEWNGDECDDSDQT